MGNGPEAKKPGADIPSGAFTRHFRRIEQRQAWIASVNRAVSTPDQQQLNPVVEAPTSTSK